MSDNKIEKILNILTNELGVDFPKDKIGLEDGFQAVLGLDSIGFIELRFQCEQVFKVTIEDEHFVPQNFKNLKSLSTLIDQLQA
ncbi:MAG: acyl carrier protein [Gammaproteobacteria bacterium]